MYDILLALHVTATSLVVGTLFLQSLMAVMALRLKVPQQREGVRILQLRVHLFIYYPILVVALGSGFWIASLGNAFAGGRWLHWKLVLVILLIGLGLLTGQQLRGRWTAKGPAMAVHILIFILSGWIVYMATAKPF